MLVGYCDFNQDGIGNGSVSDIYPNSSHYKSLTTMTKLVMVVNVCSLKNF